MMKCVFVFATSLFVLAMAPRAAFASTISFEDTGQSGACGATTLSTTSVGFVFTSPRQNVCNGTRVDLVSNGTNFLVADTAVTINMAPVAGGTFSLSAFDYAELYWASQYPASIRVTGSVFGGGTLSQTLTMDGIMDGPNGALVDFQHGTLSGFTNLTSASFQALSGFGSPAPNFSLDNIVVTDERPSSVPEPATLGLMGFGLVAIASLLRRKI